MKHLDQKNDQAYRQNLKMRQRGYTGISFGLQLSVRNQCFLELPVYSQFCFKCFTLKIQYDPQHFQFVYDFHTH